MMEAKKKTIVALLAFNPLSVPGNPLKLSHSIAKVEGFVAKQLVMTSTYYNVQKSVHLAFSETVSTYMYVHFYM
jgi:hypothetical protein